MENNKLIAEFMLKGNSELYIPNYHESWDWIIPVIERIEKLGGFVNIINNNCEIYTIKDDDYDFVSEYNIKYTTSSKIEAVYLAVVEFIKWYNDQVKK